MWGQEGVVVEGWLSLLRVHAHVGAILAFALPGAVEHVVKRSGRANE